MIDIISIEDSAPDFALLEQALADLKAQIRLRHFKTVSDFLSSIQTDSIIILDLNLPDAYADEAVKIIRGARPDATIIVLTGMGHGYMTGAAIDGLIKSGAHDVVQKDNMFDLLPSIIRDLITI